MLGVDGPSLDLEIPWDLPVIPRKDEIVSLEGLGIFESEEFADLEPFLFTVDLVSYAYKSGQ